MTLKVDAISREITNYKITKLKNHIITKILDFTEGALFSVVMLSQQHKVGFSDVSPFFWESSSLLGPFLNFIVNVVKSRLSFNISP